MNKSEKNPTGGENPNSTRPTEGGDKKPTEPKKPGKHDLGPRLRVAAMILRGAKMKTQIVLTERQYIDAAQILHEDPGKWWTIGASPEFDCFEKDRRLAINALLKNGYREEIRIVVTRCIVDVDPVTRSPEYKSVPYPWAREKFPHYRFDPTRKDLGDWADDPSVRPEGAGIRYRGPRGSGEVKE